ncbi:hypothetical protein [Roseivirga misakiensis]|uniref:Outer membrane protein beta-barrel domain-containing protein n=1 Tax=Roseivirga misakiensis TaxID=1563681 RepID=A0A1E5SKF5_9BACT|nr:hypothetical protein [Roseivirga misakiensis]OEJ99605.1 hypothetical protein BFP71_08510 [Roseivirga misakiensis]
MRKIILGLLLIVGSYGVASAQVYFEEDEVDSLSFKDKLYFGGNFSFNIGNRFTFIDISPLAGYLLTDDFSVGAGVNYQYLRREFINAFNGDRFTLSNGVYGGRLFARHNILDDYFAHVELETVNTEVVEFDNFGRSSIGRDWVPGFFIGGGYTQPVFGRAGINVTVLYNLLHDDARSPYNSAFIIRGGITL